MERKLIKMRNSKSLENKIKETIEKYDLITEGDKIVLGVSGGPDSICMLDFFYNMMKESKKEDINKKENNNKGVSPWQKIAKRGVPMAIVVAHVNHMIREEASEDEEYVRRYCEKNGIEFFSKSIDVKEMANNNKIGTEEAGRIARYDFFDEVLKKTNSNKVAIAHNKNDKIETIIMHILRGSGTSGLIGIEPKRGIYIRPLIECERKDIENYCEEQRLNPRIDRTNFENVYTRNKIRNIAIPYIQKEFNPNIIQTIDRLSSMVLEEEKYMEKQVKKIYNDILIDESEKEIILDLKQFNEQEKVIKSRIIRYTITRLLGSSNHIELIHMEDIIKLCSKNIGNKYLTPNKNLKVLVKKGRIYFSHLYNN